MYNQIIKKNDTDQVINNLEMEKFCNLTSYYSFMNRDCVIYGVYAELVILGIEIIISLVIATVLCIICDKKETQPKEIIDNIESTKTDEIINLEDSQMTSGVSYEQSSSKKRCPASRNE